MSRLRRLLGYRDGVPFTSLRRGNHSEEKRAPFRGESSSVGDFLSQIFALEPRKHCVT
jgi:hypothetical protein